LKSSSMIIYAVPSIAFICFQFWACAWLPIFNMEVPRGNIIEVMHYSIHKDAPLDVFGPSEHISKAIIQR
jgi:hypothetical protein